MIFRLYLENDDKKIWFSSNFIPLHVFVNPTVFEEIADVFEFLKQTGKVDRLFYNNF